MTTIETPSYIPKAGSLAARLIAYFKANPGEELSRHDVATKFGVAPASIDNSVLSAVQHGFLASGTNDESVRVWRAGKAIAKAVLVSEDAPPQRRRRSVQTKALPAPAEIRVEANVPIPDKPPRGDTYTKLFEGMKPNDSFSVPADVGKRMYEHARRWGVKVGRKFTLRHLDDKEARIWRIS